MKTIIAIFLLLVVLPSTNSAEGGATNIVVTPLDVDSKSVKLYKQNLVFRYYSKTPEEIRGIARGHSPVVVMKAGVVIARAPSCMGYAESAHPGQYTNFVGLVLIFDDLDQARLAEKTLRREDESKK